jgi:hypothetical protein
MVIPFLKPPAIVIVYLQNPRERHWGVVRSLDATGIVIQGTDLDGFDDWVRQVAAGGDVPRPSIIFFPLARVEKVLVDAPSGAAPSLAEQFARRVGKPLIACLEEMV